jgi:hypothetical protein
MAYFFSSSSSVTAAVAGGAGLAGDAGLVGQAGLAEVDLVVDQARDEQLAGQVVLLVVGGARRHGADAFDAAVADEDVGVEAPSLIDDFCVAEDEGGHDLRVRSIPRRPQTGKCRRFRRLP